MKTINLVGQTFEAFNKRVVPPFDFLLFFFCVLEEKRGLHFKSRASNAFLTPNH